MKNQSYVRRITVMGGSVTVFLPPEGMDELEIADLTEAVQRHFIRTPLSWESVSDPWDGFLNRKTPIPPRTALKAERDTDN
jgi:hypothetical protein